MARQRMHSPAYFRCVVSERFSYYRAAGRRRLADLAGAVRGGLGSSPYSIPPRFFYDDAGSALFEEICSLPEYYPTRTETGILGSVRRELAGLLGGGFRLVELGSGHSTKTRRVLDALEDAGPGTEYVPIDISDVVEAGAGSLVDDYPGVAVTGVVDTYEGGLALVRGMDGPPNLVAFLGSSLGNMCPDESAAFLDMVRSMMRPGDMFLLGLDLVKDRSILEAAYNDSAGVTARFNLNILRRINRELGADFEASLFSHQAPYNADEDRIEMYLVSEDRQTVHIPGAGITLRLRRGDRIHTENSYKYTVPQIRTMARDAGFAVRRLWLDKGGLFSVTLMEPA